MAEDGAVGENQAYRSLVFMTDENFLNITGKPKDKFEYFQLHDEMASAWLEDIIDEWEPRKGKEAYDSYDEFINEFLKYFENKTGRQLPEHWLQAKQWYFEHSKSDVYLKP